MSDQLVSFHHAPPALFQMCSFQSIFKADANSHIQLDIVLVFKLIQLNNQVVLVINLTVYLFALANNSVVYWIIIKVFICNPFVLATLSCLLIIFS